MNSQDGQQTEPRKWQESDASQDSKYSEDSKYSQVSQDSQDSDVQSVFVPEKSI